LASNETIDLESRSNFYSQAAEEYKKYDEKKSAAMKGKVQEMQEKIGALNKDIDSALQEADRLAGEGDWKAAVQKLDNALADFNKIGQKRGNREVELEGKKSGYKSAIDLAEKIKREKDIKQLDSYKTKISAELNGHKKLEFLLLQRRYELKEEGLRKTVDSVKNPGMLSGWGISSEEKQEKKE
jgi:hypothetical protein